ncbi:bifunctional metallophosphatase/5'-nucleotidase [Halovenus rubra]|uniref:Bifunctional metallophosphatase/5'-nucleotidase n=2 Tax=Halovenus rubra TaxID=869890 RepID=A0ABD5X9H0_9EURY|nr:5'-nucleotidase C-terminal domain-containing protein [Halovenus rubra]
MSVRILHYSDIENATDDPQRIGRLTRCLRDHRDDRTLVCGTGDTTSPGLLSIETGGEHAHRFFEAADPDFSVPGNHDFDSGVDRFRDIAAESPQTWLIANLADGDRPVAHDLGVRATAVTTVGTERVGFVGVTDPGTLADHVTSGELTVTDPVAAAEDAVADLPSDLDYVVVLSHAGSRDDDIARIDRVDMVLGGHDHERRADTVAETPVAHPGERGERLTEAELTGEGATATLHDVTEYPVAEDVAGTYRELFTELGLNEMLTDVDSPVGRDRNDRYPETPIGNFVVDSIRWAADADVAVVHPLMLRSGPPLEETVSVGDVRSTTPFDNDLHSTCLDGDELVALFESLASPEFLELDAEVYGHVSGATLSWRRDDDGLELLEATVDGERPDATESYTVAAPSLEFISDGLYPVLTEECIEVDHGSQHDALVGHAREQGIDSEIDGRMQVASDTASGEFRSLR